MKNIVFCIICFLVACSPAPTDVYETTSQAKWSTATIEIHWVRKADINDVCNKLGASDSPSGFYNACARSKPNSNVCEIYAVQPSKFDDTPTLTTFGHEVWHCFGATHK